MASAATVGDAPPVRRTSLLAPDAEPWTGERPIIELESVHKAFDAPVLADLSLSVPAGLTTVIAGESGSGKSVLLKLMIGLHLPDKGVVRLFGEDLAAIDERRRIALRKRCSMVFQSYALIDSMTVFENVAFPLAENTSMTRAEIAAQVHPILEMLDIADAHDLLPASISGGMRKRVSLARAIVTRPEVVLFDEPTTGLDPIMIETVDDYILRMREEFGITQVVISHDMASNARLADRMALLGEGRILDVGAFDAVIRSTAPAAQAFLAQARTERLERGDPEDGAPHTGAPAAADGPDEDVAIRVRGLTKRFGDREVLTGIDLEVPARQITVVIGGSGAGKSVLMKHLVGLLTPDAGEISIFGQDVLQLDKAALRAVRSRIGMLFQGAALLDSLTLRENIAFPLAEVRGSRRSRADIQRAVEEVAEKIRIPHLLDRLPGEVSNGERKRAGLARALVSRPDIVIYDEPTTGQDPVMMRMVDDMIVEAADAFDITSVVISHDMVSTFRIADHIAYLADGRVVAAGTPDALRASADPRVQRFIFAGGSE